MFNKIDEGQVMEIEKELISLDSPSFEMIEDYLAHEKLIHLKLGECGKYFSIKDEHLIELVLMNLRTPYDVFYSTFCVNWTS